MAALPGRAVCPGKVCCTAHAQNVPSHQRHVFVGRCVEQPHQRCAQQELLRRGLIPHIAQQEEISTDGLCSARFRSPAIRVTPARWRRGRAFALFQPNNQPAGCWRRMLAADVPNRSSAGTVTKTESPADRKPQQNSGSGGLGSQAEQPSSIATGRIDRSRPFARGGCRDRGGHARARSSPSHGKLQRQFASLEPMEGF